MAGTLTIVGVVLLVGWAAWWWLLRGHQQGVEDLMHRVDELEQRHESR